MKLLATVTGLLLSYAYAQEDGITVQTQQGPVSGTLVSAGVRQFLGIPYAVANRWEAPQPPPSRSATFKATSFGDTCVQSLTISNREFLSLFGLGGQNVKESEDCLSVNIWTPAVERKQGTAVMLWIYGGGFNFGTSNTVYYHGQNIVQDNDDVTVVSFNYRMNVFGQPNAPQLMGGSQSQNFGLLDQKAAIQWVHENIAAFGGDPERIILFGESAGSLSADAYMYANPSDTIIKGVIEESGSLAGNSILAPQTNTSAVVPWIEVATAVGCGAFATAAQLFCMKVVPFRILEDTVVALNAVFSPTPDGITYFSDTTSRSASGTFLRVPLLVGNNAQEGDVFVAGLVDEGLAFEVPGLTQIGSDTITQLIFVCPAGITASDRIKAGVPTWRYRYEAVFPDISSRADLRAYHASEIPIVFGTYNSSAFPASATGAENALSQYVQGAWVAFARDPVQGMTNYGWPMYNPDTASLVQLGNAANQSGVSFTQGAAFDTGCKAAEAEIALAEKIIGLTGGVF